MKSVVGIAGAIIVLMGSATAVALIRSGTPASQPPPVVYGFDGHLGWAHGEVKPSAIYFGAGGSLFVRGISWASWNQAQARGQGTRWADNCLPSCAAGSYAKSAAQVTLWLVRYHNGQQYFSRMTIAWRASGTLYRQAFGWSRGSGTSPVPFWH